MNDEFISAFSGRIGAFLDCRTARGFKRETYIWHFIRFDRWCAEKQPGQDLLSREIVHGWIDDDKAPCHELSHRAAAVRLFGRYLCSLGEDAYVLPDKYTPIKSHAAVFVFTDAELSALFESIDFLVPAKKEPFLNEIVSVLFRLIYTCGLRPNEGRELLAENVFLDTGAVLITHTKRNKERFVAMSGDMAALARRYDQRRRIFGGGSPYFFPSAGGGPLSAETIHSALNMAWSHADIDGKHPGKIRVYSLRHQFASACLNRWPDNGENLMAMLPFLREYMGHKNLSETACYIHILPENLIKSPAIDWDKFNAMFQEVEK